MNIISLKIPDTLKQKLDAFSRKRGLNQSEVVREALQAYLSREEVRREGSFFDLSSDLAGTVNGPDDLSTNKTYVDGFGT
jgi:predicted transcriptional regulator